jgi:protein-tyrosine phosphatase
MRTELHWVDGPWPGRLALAARPRGGDWLAEEIERWKRDGVHTVCSLLTKEEERDLEMSEEEHESRACGLNFFSYPIPDRQVPASEAELSEHLQALDHELSEGRNVVLHCRQGIGRTGLVAACLLVTKGLSSSAAVELLSVARGIPVPETDEQRRWIDHFAESLVAVR